MNSLRWLTVFLFTACGAAWAADVVTFAPRDGILVLRNGAILAGHITPLGESYVVVPHQGGEVRVPRTEVDFDCANLEEAYRIKRDWLEKDDFRSHIELAEWCLRHGLLDRAADQLLTAEMREPGNPRLAEMDRRLAARIAPDPSPETKVVSHVPGVAVPLFEPVDLEPHLIQQFTTTIQPILFNRCASFQCHGGGSSAYRLIRPAGGQVPTSRMTQRNLQATMVYIDRSQPEQSRLMAMAQQPHGRVMTAIFHEKTGNQLELLAGWVRQLRESAKPLTRSREAMQWQPPTAEWPPREDTSARPAPPAELNASQESGRRLDAELDAASPGHPAAARPVDPFDPAAFNERFHPGPQSDRP